MINKTIKKENNKTIKSNLATAKISAIILFDQENNRTMFNTMINNNNKITKANTSKMLEKKQVQKTKLRNNI